MFCHLLLETEEGVKWFLFQDISWSCHHCLRRNAGTTCSSTCHYPNKFWGHHHSGHWVIVVGKLEKSRVDCTAQICLYRAIMGEGCQGSSKRISSSPLLRALLLPCERRVREKPWLQSPATVRQATTPFPMASF